MILSVWAPAAKAVEAVIGDQRHTLQSLPEGRWQIELPEETLAGGYKYSIDGGDPLPDPRSAWQPHGVHGASYLLPTLRKPVPFKPTGIATGRHLRVAHWHIYAGRHLCSCARQVVALGHAGCNAC